MYIGAFKLENKNQIAVVIPVSERDFDKAIRAAVSSTHTSCRIIDPMTRPEVYESAYKAITSKLDRNEALTILDRAKAKVSFFTPKREAPAWSAWIRVVDVTPIASLVLN